MHSFHAPSRDRHRHRAAVVDICGDLVAATTAITAAVAATRVLGGQPTSPDDVVVHLASVAAIVVAVWWIANVVAWRTAMRRGGRVARFTLPGTKRAAQLLLAVSLSTTACSIAADGSPTMQLVAAADDLSADDLSADDLTSTIAAPSLDAPTTEPTGPTTEPTGPTTEPTGPTTEPTGPTTVPTEPAAPITPTTVPMETATSLLGHEIWEHDIWNHNASAPSALPPSLPDASTRGTIPDHRIVVAAGDNLWLLAERALLHHGSTDPTVAEVARYWRSVVAANDVRSGNPDLIVPGETIAMPAYTPGP